MKNAFQYLFMFIWFLTVLIISLSPWTPTTVSLFYSLYPPWFVSLIFSLIIFIVNIYQCAKTKISLNPFCFYVVSFNLMAGFLHLHYILMRDFGYLADRGSLLNLLLVQTLVQPLLICFNTKSLVNGLLTLGYLFTTIITSFWTELILQNVLQPKYYISPSFGLWTFVFLSIQIAAIITFLVFCVLKYHLKKQVSKSWLTIPLTSFLLFSVLVTYLQAIRINPRMTVITPTIPPF